VKESESQREFSGDKTTALEMREHNRCETCGEEYEQPLLAENLSGSSLESYYACSRCLSRVAGIRKPSQAVVEEESPAEETLASEEVGEVEEIPNIPKGKIEVNVQASCQHQLGYLKKRDRGSAIPDECLICTKMIECM